MENNLIKRLFWKTLSKNEWIFLKIKFHRTMGYPLNLRSPKSFSEKLQWMKLYYRKTEMTDLVDKYSVKQIIADRIGKEYLIPTYGIYNSVDEINWQVLPNSFVLKCTHDSGSVIICNDKQCFNISEAEESLKKHLKTDYYSENFEWPYKNVKPRIICEKNMCSNGEEVKDYKWFCFDGKPRFILIASGRNTNRETTTDFFDMDFQHLPFRSGHDNSHSALSKPPRFEEMKDIASIISKGYPHMRVDLYDINGHIYFGEVTFFHWGGFVPFDPPEWDYKIGEMMSLPSRKECRNLE